MAKLKVSIGKVITEMFSGFDPAVGNDYSVMRIFSSSPVVCPLCHTKVKAYTKHECRKENK